MVVRNMLQDSQFGIEIFSQKIRGCGFFDDLGNSEPYEVRLNMTKEEIVQALA
jgi:hypothetical protein